MRITVPIITSIVIMLSLFAFGRLPATEINTKPIAYFVDQIPSNIDVARYHPIGAKDIIIARVRLDISMGVTWLGGRHCERCTNDVFGARISIIKTISGNAETGQSFDILFGQRSDRRILISYPGTPQQMDREYYVAMYLDADGKRRLAPFDISEIEYEKWHAEKWAYERLRNQPGFRDR